MSSNHPKASKTSSTAKKTATKKAKTTPTAEDLAKELIRLGVVPQPDELKGTLGLDDVRLTFDVKLEGVDEENEEVIELLRIRDSRIIFGLLSELGRPRATEKMEGEVSSAILDPLIETVQQQVNASALDDAPDSFSTKALSYAADDDELPE